MKRFKVIFLFYSYFKSSRTKATVLRIPKNPRSLPRTPGRCFSGPISSFFQIQSRTRFNASGKLLSAANRLARKFRRFPIWDNQAAAWRWNDSFYWKQEGGWDSDSCFSRAKMGLWEIPDKHGLQSSDLCFWILSSQVSLWSFLVNLSYSLERFLTLCQRGIERVTEDLFFDKSRNTHQNCKTFTFLESLNNLQIVALLSLHISFFQNLRFFNQV